MSMTREELPGNAPSSTDAPRPLVDHGQLDAARRRVEELVTRTRELETANRQLQDGLEKSTARADLAEGTARSAEQLVRSMERGFEQLRKSAAMQLGYTVMESLRSWRGMLSAPGRILRILSRGRAMADLERQEQAVEVPVPQEWFPIGLRVELERFHARLAPPGREPDDGMAKPGGQRSGGVAVGNPRATRLPADVSGLRIAAIMDEFTFAAFRECCQIQQLHPETFESDLEGFDPHMLFIESAWHGRDGAWERLVSNAGGKLAELVASCRRRGIPVAFWSKEDPVHFKTFIRTAAMADYVFTTDIDCIKHYKRELGHDRVFLLPFATEQRSHNPVEKYQRIDKLCFAGSYYRRYPVRQKDFDALVQASEQMGGLDIYDRNHGKDHPNYTFPDRYREMILGGLPFDQIDLAYKGYEYGLNINTVKRSQSMFARRVFDLMASGTITVSNYARGLRLMFGDLVVSSDDSREVVRRLKPMREDAGLRRRMKLAGIRKVMREHTYERRLQYLAEKVLSFAPDLGRVKITALAIAGDEAGLAKAVADFRRQDYAHKSLVIVVRDGFVPRVSPAAIDIALVPERAASPLRLRALLADGYAAFFHPDDYYAGTYLGDLADAAFYSREAVIGKAARFEQAGGDIRMVAQGAQYHLDSVVALRAGICRGGEIQDATLRDVVEGMGGADLPVRGLAIDEFSYCLGGNGHPDVARVVDSEVDVDHGISVDELLARAEAIHAETSSHREATDGAAGLDGLDGAAIAQALGQPSNKFLAVECADGLCAITSTVPIGKHAYAYLAGNFAPHELGITDIVRMQLAVEQGGGAIELVLVYLGADGGKISHHILKSGMNVTATVPEGVARVQLGFRVSKPGTVAIRKLAFDHVPLAVDELLSRGKYLVLAKNYPSYDDLYKHAFVHRRVVEYRRQGVDVDVFRIGTDGLDYYEFEGVDVIRGEAGHLRALLEGGAHEAILVHFLDERMWDVLKDFVDTKRIFVWAHGAEIQSANRREFDQHDDAQRERAKKLGDRRMKFWKGLFENRHPNLRMVFVSEWFARDVMDDVGVEIPRDSYEVIHNFVDTQLFAFRQKTADDRVRILSIRPYESAKYANDLSVKAVLALRSHPEFEQMHFRFLGDGALFEQTLEPLRGLPNVVIERRFLAQSEIAEIHGGYGVFLCPTRMDAQGVSRDEAMASGLVPVTSGVTAIPEFVDAGCGFLAGAEDAEGLAEAMLQMCRDPALFLRLSSAAADRVRSQSGYAQTIEREIDMFTTSYQGVAG
jgi:glycosyltransferase involved in cell wall biosynthesis/spore maturation protein CgeB